MVVFFILPDLIRANPGMYLYRYFYTNRVKMLPHFFTRLVKKVGQVRARVIPIGAIDTNEYNFMMTNKK